MPHVVMKMYAGRSEQDKAALAAAITRAITDTIGGGNDSVSVAIEDIEPSRWMAQVYAPEITAKESTLYKRPGYGPTR